MTKKYTVVLLRPDYLCADIPQGQDVYVAHVEAEDEAQAFKFGQKEVAAMDNEGIDLEDQTPYDDYALSVMFEGHHSPILYGADL